MVNKKEESKGLRPSEMDELLELNVTDEIIDKVKDNIGKTVDDKLNESISSERLRRIIRNNPKIQEALAQDMTPKQIMNVINTEITDTDIHTLTEEDISINTNKLMNMIMGYLDNPDLDDDKKIKVAERFIGKLADLKKSFYPATQRNLNVNVEVFKDKINTWRQEREKMYMLVGADNNDKQIELKKEE